MTIYDRALDLLHSLKEQPWQPISIGDAIESLEGDFIGDAMGEIIGVPGNIMRSHAWYADELRGAWEQHGITPVRKSTHAAEWPENLEHLIDDIGETGNAPHDPKRRYRDFSLLSQTATAFSEEAGDQGIDRKIREITLEAERCKKHWRAVNDNGQEYYERSMRDDPENALRMSFEGLFADALKPEEAQFGYLDSNGHFFPHEKKSSRLPSSGEMVRLDDPAYQEMLEEARQIAKENKEAERAVLEGTSPVIRILKTAENAVLLKEQLGIDIERHRKR